MNIESPAGSHQFIPNSQRLVARHPDFITEIAGVASARNLDGNTSKRSFCHSKVLQASDVRVADQTLKQAPRSRALQRERGYSFRDVFNFDLHAAGILSEPTQAGICRSPAISVFFKTRHSAIIDHFALLVTPRRIDDLAHR